MGYSVFDGFLPPEKTPYPFIYIGDFQQTEAAGKNKIHGSVFAQVHVWCDSPRKRGTLSAIMLDVKRAMRGIERTDNFAWLLRNFSQHILPDNTTKTPLLHGIVEAEALFS